jgi:autotransporter-associated beta strand protein
MKPIRILRHHTHLLAASFSARSALAVFAAALASQTAKAATFLWDGDASSANGQSNVSANQSLNWLNGGNWDNGTTSAPLASWTEGDNAILGGSTAETITLTEGITVGALRIGSGTNGLGTDPLAYTISGSTLTFQSSNITTASGTTATISSAVGAGTGFTKSGTGTLILQNTAPAPFTSGIALNAGRLEFKATGARETYHPLTGSGTLVLTAMSGGTNQVRFRSTAAGGGNGDNSFTGPIIMEGGNAQTLRFDTLAAGGDITMNATTGTGGNIIEFYHSGALGRKIVFSNVANALNANPTGTGFMTIKFGNASGLSIDEFENQATIARTFRFYGSSGDVGVGTINANLTDGVGADTPLSITTSFNGLWTLTGNNTFTGGITISNSGATGLGNTIKIGGNGTLGYVSPGVGNYNGNISIAGPTGLFIVDSTATQTLGGVISNASPTNTSPGTLAKGNTGTLILTNNNIYTGETYVTAGTLIVNGSIASSALTTVENGATLGGTGTVGALTIDEGGIFSPGNSPGIQTVMGNYTQNGTLRVEIEGGTAGNGSGFHDRVNVTGEVTLGALSLLSLANFSGTYAPNDLIFLLLNDGTDAITGTFDGLAQGDVVSNHGGFDWQISYVADGDSLGSPAFTGGNDIALMAVAIPEPSAALLGGSGLLMLLRRRRK